MKMRPEFPTTQQIRQLPLQFSRVVPREWEDRNGHVNVQFYETLYEQGGYQILEHIDIDRFLRENGYGLFDLEHHLHYRSEILVGDRVSTYNRIIGHNEKRFHGMYFIINDRSNTLACTLEYVTAGVDLRSRRTAPFPDRIRQGIAEQLQKHEQLEWAVPVCGAMGLRSSAA